jgi:macrodomain Ter protein organizer (MatP/YcbG family)
MTAIIALRVYPSWKRKAIEEAEKRGKTLSEFIYSLIEIGWEKADKMEDVKQKDERTV